MAQLQATVVNGTLNSLREDNITTTSKDLQLADRDRVVVCNNTGPITITVPNDSNINFPIGSIVYISRVNTGQVTLAAAGGVSVNRSGLLGSSEELTVRKRGANQWQVIDRPFTLTGSGGTTVTSGSFTTHSFTSGSGTFTVQN